MEDIMSHQAVDTNEIGKDFFGYFELSEYLKVSVHTLRQWVSQGRVPHLKLAGGSLVRFRREDILRWLEDSKVEAE